MILKAFIGIHMALLFFNLPSAFPQEFQPSVPSKETKSTDKPVILGDKILFHLATETEGRTLAKRAEVVSERIKKNCRLNQTQGRFYKDR
jgi:hypothetical protein